MVFLDGDVTGMEAVESFVEFLGVDPTGIEAD